MNITQEVLLKLIKAVNTQEKIQIPADVDWHEVMQLAFKQGVQGIAFDAFNYVPTEQRPERKLLLAWYGNVGYMETLYDKHKKVITSLAKFYGSLSCPSDQGGDDSVRMMLLKGYGLSLHWPTPKHRPTGDIDTFNFGKHEFADKKMQEKYGVRIDNSHHKHSVFMYHGVTVENHYSFLNAHGHKSTAEIEKILHEVIGETADSEIPNLYYPSVRFNSLYLLRHSGEHFASVDLNLRQVLDWGYFVASHSYLINSEKSMDWDWLLGTLDKVGMKTYLAVLNSICIEYLGFKASLFPEIHVSEALVQRSLEDILHPEVDDEHHENTVLEIIFRFKRWWKNRWKHNMVFKESLWQSLVHQIYSHMLKRSL